MSWLTLLQMENLSAWADAIDRSCGRAHVLCYRPGPRPLHCQHNPYITRTLIYYTVSESCCEHCTSFVTVKSVSVVQGSFSMCMHDGCILWARSAMYCQLMHAISVSGWCMQCSSQFAAWAQASCYPYCSRMGADREGEHVCALPAIAITWRRWTLISLWVCPRESCRP